eukprot:TRINITY_DN26482_c0_g1_i1.p1 TRINITY_DN26482_c0_g1~~TRINITY_DN26482_c0_g1_i1.p1  ORF type:complete len:677 (-),score=117.30 TRINITY_DN26482_c0_g1_i1:106-2136(-)
MAMILRFRVGRMVVKEMRRAIVRQRTLEHAFRQTQTYVASNIPASTRPACDDAIYRNQVQAISAEGLVAPAASAVPAFVQQPCGLRSMDEAPTAGYSLTSLLGCPRRAGRFDLLSAASNGNSEDESPRHSHTPKPLPTTSFVPWHGDHVPGRPRWSRTYSLRRTGSGDTLASGPVSQSEPDREQMPDSVSPEQGSREDSGLQRSADAAETADASAMRLAAASEGAARGMFPAADIDLELGQDGSADKDLRELADVHTQLLQAREQEDSDFYVRLEELRREYCKPYDKASQQSFFHGTIMLVASACAYSLADHANTRDKDGDAFAWFYTHDGNGPFFPTQPFAGWVFMISSLIPVVGLLYMEAANRRARARAKAECHPEGFQAEYLWVMDTVSPRRLVKIIGLLLLMNSAFWVMLSAIIPIDHVAVIADDVRGHPAVLQGLPDFFQARRATYDYVSKGVVLTDNLGAAVEFDFNAGKRRVRNARTFNITERRQTGSPLTAACLLGGARGSSEGWIDLTTAGGAFAPRRFSVAPTDHKAILDALKPDEIFACHQEAEGTRIWFGSGEILYGAVVKFIDETTVSLTGVRTWRVPELPAHCGSQRCSLQDAEQAENRLVVLLSGGVNNYKVVVVLNANNGKMMWAGLAPRGDWTDVAGDAKATVLIDQDNRLFIAGATAI